MCTKLFGHDKKIVLLLIKRTESWLLLRHDLQIKCSMWGFLKLSTIYVDVTFLLTFLQPTANSSFGKVRTQTRTQTRLIKWAASRQNQQIDCAPKEDSDQPGHPPSLIRVFAVRMKKAWALSYPLSAQRRLWSDWADAQADLSLPWAHSHFVGVIISWLKSG